MPAEPQVGTVRRALLVLGMHRSGTSYVTSVCAAYGYALPGDLLPGNPWNPPGYFESKAIVAVNDRVLQALRRSWWDIRPLPERAWSSAPVRAGSAAAVRQIRTRFGDAPLIVLKDPRVSVLLPMWRAALERSGCEFACLIALRPPAEVATSLLRRDGMTPLMGLALWWRYVSAAVTGVRDLGLRAAVVNFPDVVYRPAVIGDSIERLGWQASADAGALDALPRKELMRSQPSDGVEGDALLARCEELYERLRSEGASLPAFDENPAEFRAVLRLFEPWRDLFERHHALVSSVRRARRLLDAGLDDSPD